MFLSFEITPEGMCINDSKVQSLNKWLIPTKAKKVQLFLEFMKYFHKFIYNSSAIVELLHKLICKNELFAWTDLCQLIFEELKCHMMSAPMLKIYDSIADT